MPRHFDISPLDGEPDSAADSGDDSYFFF